MTSIIFLRSLIREFSAQDIRLEHLTGAFVIIMLTAALVCFLVSEITRNYSQVDKLWSLMPVIYSLLALATFHSERILIMSILVTVWGIRLSFNFYRKGGYNLIPWKGEEDYRWKNVRQRPELKGRFRFGLFNFFFISFYQHFLILLFCTPLLIAIKNRNAGLNILDLIASLLMLIFIVLEAISDNQMYRYQNKKKQPESSDGIFSESLRNGFLCERLWRYVRHPNFISEQIIWISFYLFGIAASGKWLNWTLAGSFLLVLLFLGSTALTERISSAKYRGYADYKKDVPKYFPRIFRPVK
jgi:steroid 5-alpha reductase family enzyme